MDLNDLIILRAQTLVHVQSATVNSPLSEHRRFGRIIQCDYLRVHFNEMRLLRQRPFVRINRLAELTW